MKEPVVGPGVHTIRHAVTLLRYWAEDATDEPDILEMIRQSIECAGELEQLDARLSADGAPEYESVLANIVRDLRELSTSWKDTDVDDRNALTAKWRKLLAPVAAAATRPDHPGPKVDFYESRAKWYREGCDGLEDVADYRSSGDLERDAAADLLAICSRVRDLEEALIVAADQAGAGVPAKEKR